MHHQTRPQQRSGHGLGEPLVQLDRYQIRADGSGRSLLSVAHIAVRRGGRLVVQGRSGAGKSMLLAGLAGQLPVGAHLASGERRVAGPHVRFGLVLQRASTGLHPLMPVGRQLARVTGRSLADVAAALDELGMSDARLLARRPSELSGGQAQRVALAMAALTGASVLLADEPTSALDPGSRDETLALLRGYQEEARHDVALVVVTHDPEVARLLEADLVEIHQGRVAPPRVA